MGALDCDGRSGAALLLSHDWKTLDRELLLETPIFSLQRARKQRAAERGREHDFYIIDSVDWVNIVPVTAEDEIVFLEIYRHGTDEVSLEIPGGMIDASDASPLAAAAREMEEETGYRSDSIVPLGVVHPNPAIQPNRCFSFLAEDAWLAQEPRPDETEDLRVVRYPRRELPRLLREGRITHSLVVSALYWLALAPAGEPR